MSTKNRSALQHHFLLAQILLFSLVNEPIWQKNIVKEIYRMKQLLNRLMVEEKGQGITEYALILGLVVLGVWFFVANSGIGDSVTGIFNNVNTLVSECQPGACPP